MPNSRLGEVYSNVHSDATANCCDIVAATAEAVAEVLAGLENPNAQEFRVMAQQLKARGREFREVAREAGSRPRASDATRPPTS